MFFNYALKSNATYLAGTGSGAHLLREGKGSLTKSFSLIR